MEDNIIQLITAAKQKRAKVLKDQSDILAAARNEQRAFNESEEAAYAKAETDFTTYDAEVRRLEQLKEREERTAMEQHEQNGGQGAIEGMSDDEVQERAAKQARDRQENRYGKVFTKYMRYGLSALSQEERSLLHDRYDDGKAGKGEIRAQTVTTTGGGYAIPQGFAGRVEQVLKYYGPMLDGSVTGVLNTQSGNTIPYPTLNGTSTSGRLLAINTQVTTTDLTFGSTSFDSYKFSSDAILVPVELLEDEDVNLETDVIEYQLGERLGRIMNTYFTTGTGSSQPNGVVTASSAGKTASGSTAFTRDEIIDLIHSVDRAYRMGPKVGIMLHDSVLASIRKMALGSGDDTPLYSASAREGEPDRIEGHRIFVNNDMASTIEASAKVMLFGDFSKFLVRKVRNIRMLRLTERYADYDQVGFFAFMRADSDLIASGAIKHLVMAA